MQSSQFQRTPKQWLASDRQAKVDAVKQLRLVTAIKTPYLPDGRVDLFSYDNLVEQQLASGVQGLVVGGTTGEGHLMSWDEHIMLIAHTANKRAPRDGSSDGSCLTAHAGSRAVWRSSATRSVPAL